MMTNGWKVQDCRFYDTQLFHFLMEIPAFFFFFFSPLIPLPFFCLDLITFIENWNVMKVVPIGPQIPSLFLYVFLLFSSLSVPEEQIFLDWKLTGQVQLQSNTAIRDSVLCSRTLEQWGSLHGALNQVFHVNDGLWAHTAALLFPPHVTQIWCFLSMSPVKKKKYRLYLHEITFFILTTWIRGTKWIPRHATNVLHVLNIQIRICQQSEATVMILGNRYLAEAAWTLVHTAHRQTTDSISIWGDASIQPKLRGTLCD